MTEQDKRNLFESRMKQDKAFQPDLMVWMNGRYEFDTMESAYQGFRLGLECARSLSLTKENPND